MDVFFELENAQSSEDECQAVASYRSVLEAQRTVRKGTLVDSTLWVMLPPKISESLKVAIQMENREYPDVEIKHVTAPPGGYFACKNAAIENGTSPFVVFCDSDCIYEPDYFTKIAAALSSSSNAVVYGQTFSPDGEQGFRAISALTWQFPPQSIGYGRSWPRSRWANNMAVHRLVLKENPFPELISTHLRNREYKLERVIWEARTSRGGVLHEDIGAVAFHAQFSSLRAWTARQWVHGIGSATRLLSEGKEYSRVPASVRGPLARRRLHLKDLRHVRQGGLPLRRAQTVLLLGLLVRTVACFVVRIRGNRFTVIW